MPAFFPSTSFSNFVLSKLNTTPKTQTDSTLLWDCTLLGGKKRRDLLNGTSPQDQ